MDDNQTESVHSLMPRQMVIAVETIRLQIEVEFQVSTGTESYYIDNVVVNGTAVSNGDTTPPSAPTGLTSSSKTDTSISLSWATSTDNSGSIASYEVWMDSSFLSNVGNTTSYTAAGLSQSTAYTFQVRAIDPSGNQSALSSSISVTTDATSSGGGGSGSGTLWTENGGNIYYSSGRVGIGTSTTSNGTLTVTGDHFNTLRLENNSNNKEASIRFRSKDSGGNLFHADFATYHDGNRGFVGIKSPANNAVGQGFKFVVTDNGNTGVGTTSPLEKLHISNGLIRIDQATNQDNNSPGLVAVSDDDFLYDNQYLNHYGFGFHGFQDGSSTATEPRNSYVSGYFGIDLFTGGANRMRVSRDGVVSIGTLDRPSGYLLAVNGKIRAREIRVDNDNWADFVFANDYDLPTLEEVRKFIEKHGHLPSIPSAETVEKEGIELGEMNKLLLQKIEELTLYILQMENDKQELEQRLQLIEKKLAEIK